MKAIKTFICFICFIVPISLYANSKAQEAAFKAQIKQIESNYGGRIGIAAINTADDHTLTYKAHEAFPFCSTFKFIVSGAILKESMSKPSLLSEKITYGDDDLVNAYSPITEENLMAGKTAMSIRKLAKAAIFSDTTATNLLIIKLGGNEKINQFAKAIGNESFRLDRFEPEINTAIPKDLRDTSTPLDMAKSIKELALGKTLRKPLKIEFQNWLIENDTGNERIRAVVANNWIIGDKTGTGDYGTTNDVAILWPPEGQKPIIISIYYTQTNKYAMPNNQVIQLSAKAALNAFGF
ncbi:class A beta-lactamase [Thiotrichales bacterium 19S11-10]|nr:class A beta-lactamase [Thiotrichales bacterium 19S11-10]